MTVQELKEALDTYPGDMHVVVAILAGKNVTSDTKREVHDVWLDSHRVLNIIAVTSACDIDLRLRQENELK